jgi:hypothetical protein
MLAPQTPQNFSAAPLTVPQPRHGSHITRPQPEQNLRSDMFAVPQSGHGAGKSMRAAGPESTALALEAELFCWRVELASLNRSSLG